MADATLLAIHIAHAKNAALQEVPSAELLTGRGIAGDRYFDREPHRSVTLIEARHLQATTDALGIPYEHGLTRRNLTIHGLDLNALVGRRFRIGEVLLEGTELCQPCGLMESCVGEGAEELLHNKAGIRAAIIEGGSIRVGDPLAVLPAEISATV